MGLAPNFTTVFVGDSIGCEVPDPIFHSLSEQQTTFVRNLWTASLRE